MYNVIFINGAPGTGKSTTAIMLQKQLDSPYIEFSDFREWHLDNEWINENKEEEHMSFENLIFVLKNYIKHNYKNVLVTDLRDYRTIQIPELFNTGEYCIITLIVNDDEILKKRILARSSGFKDYGKAIEWNKREQDRHMLPNEIRIDTTKLSSEDVVSEILKHLRVKV